jgi:Domain of unknown function (DUF5069)
MDKSIPLRSPRVTLGGYILLPRLIDKIRLHAKGSLPTEYVSNLLAPAPCLDGQFLAFTGLDPEALRKAILAAKTDAEVLDWVERNAKSHSETEKRQWMEEIDSYRPNVQWAEYRREIYKNVAAKVDPASLSILDLIDMDEGRMPIKSPED